MDEKVDASIVKINTTVYGREKEFMWARIMDMLLLAKQKSRRLKFLSDIEEEL